MKLQAENWYWSRSLKHGVKFVEICDVRGKDFNKAYVEFSTENGTPGGAYLDQTDLFENSWDAAMSIVSQ